MSKEKVLFQHLVEDRDTDIPVGKGSTFSKNGLNSMKPVTPYSTIGGTTTSDGGGHGNFATLGKVITIYNSIS